MDGDGGGGGVTTGEVLDPPPPQPETINAAAETNDKIDRDRISAVSLLF